MRQWDKSIALQSAVSIKRAGSGASMNILITEEQIGRRIDDLGRQIEADYQGRPLTIVAILTGSLIVLADLIREIQLPLRVALLQASSYKGATTSAGALIINESFAPDVAGRDVLLLDDILDTGHTLGTLVHRMADRGALSVKTAVLLRKRGRQEVKLEPDYTGLRDPRPLPSSATASTTTTTIATCPTSPSCLEGLDSGCVGWGLPRRADLRSSSPRPDLPTAGGTAPEARRDLDTSPQP